jgi:MEDS: MEthanogen/methylotroph, DcmR Sensory domain
VALTCPACQTVIRHLGADAAPQQGAICRCPVCRLELIVDADGKNMTLAPFRAHEQDAAQRSKKTKTPPRRADAADRTQKGSRMMNARRSVSARSDVYPHAVKFYNDEASLGRTVAEFLAPGLRKRLPAIVIATPEHRTLIANELEQRNLNVGQLEGDGDLQMLDAEEILDLFMAGNEPDPVRFHAAVDGLIERACKGRPHCPVRMYGEMVDILWKRAKTDGAIRLEILWNHVATDAEFSLLCGYAVGNFYKEITSGPTFQTVCDQHHHIIPAEETA